MKTRFLPLVLSLGVLLPLGAAPVALAAPTIEGESVSKVTPTSAVLEAQINPESAEHSTLYQFQVALNPSELRPEFACPTKGFPAGSSLCLGLESQPGALPLQWLAAGTEGEAVSLDLAQAGMELQPNTTYQYRVIAAQSVLTVDTIAWADPIVYGAGKTFKTSGSPPIVESESVSDVTPTGATLEAAIDPGGLEASYEFHLLKRWSCEESVPSCEPAILEIPLPAGQLPAADESRLVKLDLNSGGVTLSSGHDFYEFWVTATNAGGSGEGPAQTFSTPEEEREASEPPSQEGPPDPPKDQESGPAPSPSSGDPPKATPCRRAPRRHHAKHHRHRRAAIRKACGWV